MAAVDKLYNLSLCVQEKCSNGCDSFEEHFLWLEGVIATARQTFTSADPAFLPKTPRIKKKCQQRRPLQPDINEEEELSPNKRSPSGSLKNDSDAQSPVEAPRRRGRAASRIAQEKMKRDLLINAKRKLRRPSTPEDLRTSRKKGGTRHAVDYIDSHDRISSPEDTGRNTNTSRSQEKNNNNKKTSRSQIKQNSDSNPTPDLVFSRDAPKNNSFSRDEPKEDPKFSQTTPKKKRSSTSRVSLSLVLEKINDTNEADKNVLENITKVCLSNIAQEKAEEQTRVSDENCTYSELRLEDSDDESEVEKELNTQLLQEKINEGKKEESSSLKNLTQTVCEERKKSGNKCILSQAQNFMEKSEVLPQDSVQLSQPLPNGQTSPKQQRELQLKLNDETDNCHKIVGVTNAPDPVCKDKSESGSASESSTQIVCVKPEILPKCSEQILPSLSKGRTTRTKQRELQLTLKDETDNCHKTIEIVVDPPPPVPQPRSTRTKQKKMLEINCISDDESDIQMFPPTNMVKSRVTRSKLKTKENLRIVENEGSVEDGSNVHRETLSQHTADVSKPRLARTKTKMADYTDEASCGNSQNPRSTRTKKREVEEYNVEQSTRTTRTKRKKFEELSEKESDDQQNHSLRLTLSESDDETYSVPRQVEMNSTFVKPDSQNASKTALRNRDESADSVSSETSVKSIQLAATCVPANATIVKMGKSSENTETIPVRRITRSKVRQLPALMASPKRSPSLHIGKVLTPKSPSLSNFKRICCTPNSDTEDPKAPATHKKGIVVKSPVKHTLKPFANSRSCLSVRDMASAYQTHIGEKLNEIEELTSETCEVRNSPARVTRHAQWKDGKSPEGCGTRMSPSARTLSPACLSEKVIHPKINRLLTNSCSSSIYGTTSRVTPKTYSKIRQLHITTSSELNKSLKKIGTPVNIISGVTSFIKVPPPKPSREDLEQKRQADIQKKRDRAEESRQKKEELLKMRAEEKKRQNEERMKRVQEAREERERKAIEAQEQQEKDRKIREERLKEEQQRKKQQLLAKKRAEEEAKIRKIREQHEEEERRKQEEEARKVIEEEERRAEEARKLEEKRVLMAEQRRLQEEKKRKMAEAERIAREKRELENLRLREAKRGAGESQVKIVPMIVQKVALNETYTATDNKENAGHNSTFTKSSGNSQSSSDVETAQKSKKIKSKEYVNYNILDIKSDDSTDDEKDPKKKIPFWATKTQMTVCCIQQEHFPPVIEDIFPPAELLAMPDLSSMFPIQRKRFNKRTSSAIWNTPPAKFLALN
ncbi:inner centromere protein A isoform X2 [Procambarus clarkii]|uniref:inner centromere protein A isoform X2 n=1 Tax=Procambarus clarkii TaxID=6728 RepID=UPI001E678197|nr:inner centromere protein A-like isoform X2 [Procambarus clarkii]